MHPKINNLYEFGSFRINPEERVLYRKGHPVTLAPKVFDTLLVLVESNGRTISKEELMNEIWQDAFVEESNLTQNIYTLRQVFGKKNNFIETVPRRGYRFSEAVRAIGNDIETIAVNPEITRKESLTEVLVSKKTTTKLMREEIVESDSSENSLAEKSLLLPAASPKRSVFWSRRFQIGALFGAVAAIALGIAGYSFWQKRSQSPSNVLIDKVTFTALTETGDVGNMALSPDGQFLALIRAEPDKSQTIRLKDINSKQELPITLSNELKPESIVFSPDGNSLYFLSRSKNGKTGFEFYKTSRFGGKTELVIGEVGSEAVVSPDGTRVAFYRQVSEKNEHQLVIYNLDDRSETVLSKREFPDGFELRSAPAWSPNTKQLYVIAKPQGRPNSSLLRISTSDGSVQAIPAPQIRQFVSVVVTADGSNLLFTAREQNRFPQVYKMPSSGGELRRLTNDLNIYRKLSLSADGKRLVVMQKNNPSNLLLVKDGDVRNSVKLTEGRTNRDGKHGLDVLPDGRIVFTSIKSLNRDLWMINPADRSTRQLTSNRSEANERPFASSDGNFIYYSSLATENYRIERMTPEGQNIETITDGAEASDLFPNSSPDGSVLYFIRRSRGKSAVVYRTIATKEETEIPLPEGMNPDSFLALSPDGKMLAIRLADGERRADVEEDASNPVSIGIISVDGDTSKSRTLNVETSLSQFRWSDTSDAIHYIRNSAESSAIWKQPILSSQQPEKVVELENTRIYHFRIFNKNDIVISNGMHFDDAVMISGFN